MPRDDALDQVLEQVRSFPARQALRRWAKDEEVSLLPTGFSASGFTSAQVFGVRVHDGGKTQGLIIKVDTTDERAEAESTAHRRAWEKSVDFRRHLAEPRYMPHRLKGGGLITFQLVAGGGFDMLRTFDAGCPNHDDPAETCRKIVTSLLAEWNARTVEPEQVSAGDMLRQLLGRRIEPRGSIHNWAGEHTRLLNEPSTWLLHDDMRVINPFALAKNDRIADALILTTLRGHSHGDLHPGNLLVSARASDPPEFTLIDLSRYRTNGLLAWDPCYLMCTTVAMLLKDGISFDRTSLRNVLLAPEPDFMKIDAALPSDLRKMIAGITRGERDYAQQNGLYDEWMRQRLVCLIAIALYLSGRPNLLDRRDREWFFWLGAHAATELLQLVETADEEPLPFTTDLIRDPSLDSAPATFGTLDARGQRVSGGPRVPAEPIYHDTARDALRKRLVEGPAGVVVVTGPRGVGKSTLVTAVVADLDADRFQVYRTPTAERLRLDVKTLIDCIDGAVMSGDAGVTLRREDASPARLEAVLDAPGHPQIVIVVEGAEQLLGQDNALTDLDLDDAFESLTTRAEHCVSVVLVTSVIPQSPRGGTWPTAEPPVMISRLRYERFVSMLRDRPGGSSRVRRLDDDVLGALYRAVQGNPRLTNLFHAACVLAAHRVRLRALVDELSCLEPKEVPDALLKLLFNDLEQPVRRVLEGLAAFRIPVPEERVLALLEEQQSDEETLHGLERLVDSMLVRLVGDQYQLTDVDAGWVLNGITDRDQRNDLQTAAAAQLLKLRPLDPRHIGDLDVHFAEIRAMTGACEFEAAYEMLEILHDRLRGWNSGYLLLEDREALRGRLPDEYLEMANDNALGNIHRSRGRFHEARLAYEGALTHAEALGNDVAKLRVGANLAAMSWLDNDPVDAHRNHLEALAGADRLGDPVVRMSALEGLADCYRRWGRFAAAIEHAAQAYAVPEDAGYPDSLAGWRSRARRVNLALKLSRWHTETGDLRAAHEWLDTARQEVAESADRSQRAALSDGEADLLLWEGDEAGALRAATAAADLAAELRDPAILTRARTTLCLVHLLNGRPNDAAREIQTVVRYRRPGRSLIVLALQAVVARRQRRSAMSNTRFKQLRDEAERRLQDPDDFAARDFVALAICADVLNGRATAEDAVEAFRQSRTMTTDSLGLRNLLTLLVQQLDLCGQPRGQLTAVTAAFSAASPNPAPP